MKITLLKHSVQEGLNNMVRHPLVSLASITTITLMLFLMGTFIIFSMNARQMMTRAGEQPPVEITLNIGVTQAEIDAISASLKANPDILEFKMYTPEENFEQFKKNLGKEEIFSGFSAAYIPYTYSVRLRDPSIGEAFQAQATGLPGVRKVALELTVMKFLSKAILWVNYATLIAFVVLGVIAFFIISNMVRVAVFARGEEINIMKYVGATNWYIRVPYILEGALVGLIGSFLAWGVVCLIYNRLYEVLMAGTAADNLLAMVAPSSVFKVVLLLNILIGAGVGAVGSAISVRHHIHV
jgi:cell division transport system permease protein